MSLLFTPIFIFLLVIFARLAQLNRDTQLVGTYMSVFLEPYLEGMKWETNLYELRKLNKSHGLLFLQSHYSPNLIMLVGVYASFLYVSFVYVSELPFSFVSMTAIVCNTIICVACVFLVRNTHSSKLKEKNKLEWEKLKVSQSLCPDDNFTVSENQEEDS